MRLFKTLYNHSNIKIKVNNISKSYTLVIALVILLTKCHWAYRVPCL